MLFSFTAEQKKEKMVHNKPIVIFFNLSLWNPEQKSLLNIWFKTKHVGVLQFKRPPPPPGETEVCFHKAAWGGRLDNAPCKEGGGILPRK